MRISTGGSTSGTTRAIYDGKYGLLRKGWLIGMATERFADVNIQFCVAHKVAVSRKYHKEADLLPYFSTSVTLVNVNF